MFGWSFVREKQEIENGPWRYRYVLRHTRRTTGVDYHLWFGRWSNA